MANEKILNTRIQLKYDSLTNWLKNDPTLLAGELAIVSLGHSQTTTTPDNGTHPILFKVGPGKFSTLPFASALAADVYGWAKQETLPVVRNDGKNEDGSDKAAGNVISSIVWEGDSIKYTTASVATSEGMAELQESVQGILDDIAANREDWAEKTVDTNTDTQYRFTTDGDKLVVYKTLYTLGAAGTEEKVGEYEFLTESEVRAILADYYTKNEIDALISGYYTKNEIDALTNGKLHTDADIRTIAANEIGVLIDAAGDAEVLKSIGDLVDYVENNAADIAQLVTNVGTANDNASAAVTTAGEAKSLAETADANATTALNTANSAKEIAETAQNSASASASAASDSAAAALASQGAAAGSADAAAQAQADAESARDVAGQHKADAEAAKAAALAAQSAAESAQAAAAASESNASASATTAGQKADAAESARANSVIAQGKAEEAQAAAELAKSGAETAQSEAEKAQAAAEQAKADAEAAKQAALDSNASATAVANEAKGVAEAAKEASDAATDAVAGLHAIATSGSMYDAEEVNLGANDMKYFVFYCGTSDILVD